MATVILILHFIRHNSLPQVYHISEAVSKPGNNLSADPADSATNPGKAVIPERKIKHMRTLNSLALMLALSTNPSAKAVLTDSGKDKILKQAPVRNSSIPQPAFNVLMPGLEIQPFVELPDSGTFGASGLYWSEKNKELYFKGKSGSISGINISLDTALSLFSIKSNS